MKRLRLLLLLGLSLSPRARAAPVERTPSVQLSVDCAGVAGEEVRRIAAIELKLPVLLATGRLADTDVQISCNSTQAELLLLDNLTAKSSRRSVEISSTPTLARARLLALSVAELVSASWAELDLEGSDAALPKQRSDAARSARATVRARRRRGLEGELQAQASARRWSTSWTSMGPGLRLQLGYPLGQRWALLAASGAYLELGSRDVADGELLLRIFDASLNGLVEARQGAFRFAAGPGIRGGLLRAEGRPSDTARVAGRVGQDGYAGALLTLRAVWSPRPPMFVSCSAEGGWAFRRVDVRALGERSASAGQSWLSLSLGLGIVL